MHNLYCWSSNVTPNSTLTILLVLAPSKIKIDKKGVKKVVSFQKKNKFRMAVTIVNVIDIVVVVVG